MLYRAPSEPGHRQRRLLLRRLPGRGHRRSLGAHRRSLTSTNFNPDPDPDPSPTLTLTLTRAPVLTLTLLTLTLTTDPDHGP